MKHFSRSCYFINVLRCGLERLGVVWDQFVAGNPLLVVNLRKASKNASALNLLVSNRGNCSGRGACKQAYICFGIFNGYVFLGRVQRSREINACMRKRWVVWNSSSGNACGSCSENGCPSTLLHFTNLRKMFLAVCLPRMIQKRSLDAVNFVFTPVNVLFTQIYGLMLPRR